MERRWERLSFGRNVKIFKQLCSFTNRIPWNWFQRGSLNVIWQILSFSNLFGKMLNIFRNFIYASFNAELTLTVCDNVDLWTISIFFFRNIFKIRLEIWVRSNKIEYGICIEYRHPWGLKRESHPGNYENVRSCSLFSIVTPSWCCNKLCCYTKLVLQ